MTTTTTTAPAIKIAVLKHAISGKDTTFIQAACRLTAEQVRQIQQSHGYPDNDKMRRAIGILEQKLDGDLITEKPLAQGSVIETSDAPAKTPTVANTSFSVTTAGTPLTKPDEIRILLNTAKAHPSKRIQNAANKVFDDLDKLRQLLKADDEKHAAARAEKARREAEKKRLEEEREAARAEVERLQAELRAAKAKLTGKQPTPAKGNATDASGAPTAAAIRAWATANNIDCPPRGVIPKTVHQAYSDAHQDTAA